MALPTIVLVHGAWADASSWNPVITDLRDRGFSVLAPPNHLRNAADDGAYIAAFLQQRTDGPVVLVGHSYGGAVISAGGAHGGDVRALVYVDAFLPDEGETVFSLLGGSGSVFDVPDPSTVFDLIGIPGAAEGNPDVFLKPATVHASFAQDLAVEARDQIVAGQRPIALAANTTPAPAPAWRERPVWAVVGTEDKVIPRALQRRMAERADATIVETPSSHVSMLSAPDVAVGAIVAAAESIG